MARDLKKEYERNKEQMLIYQKATLRQFKFSLNRNTEPEMIEWLESQPNMQNYIRSLIYEDRYRKLTGVGQKVEKSQEE